MNGLAKVAAVNCDDDDNKPFCGQMDVKGFPTLKIVTPSKNPGKPRVEDYQGARSAKGIVDAVIDRIPNHVKRATDKDLDEWLGKGEERPKAVLFTEKGTTTPLIRALAIDYLGAIDFAQVRNKESASVEKYGISEFPTLVVIPGPGAEHQLYEGEMKKQQISEFLSQYASANPDASGKAASAEDSKPKPKSKSSKSASKPTSVDQDSTEAPTDSSNVKPGQVPISVPPVPTLATPESLEAACLAPKSNTCVLALLPVQNDPEAVLPSTATDALASLAEITHKHAQRGAHLFPVYAVPEINTASQTIRTGLGLEDSQVVEIVAVNARRGWWRRYGNAEDFGLAAVEKWIDAIRLGEGAKEKLPDGLVREAVPTASADDEPKSETKDEL